MIFGAGFVAGLLGEIGRVINSHTLQHISRIAWWVLPFDALYEDALHRLTVDTSGFAAFVLKLGPFGGSAHAAGPAAHVVGRLPGARDRRRAVRVFPARSVASLLDISATTEGQDGDRCCCGRGARA